MSHRYPKNRKQTRKCPKGHYMKMTSFWSDTNGEHRVLFCRRCMYEYKTTNERFVGYHPERAKVEDAPRPPNGWRRTIADWLKALGRGGK